LTVSHSAPRVEPVSGERESPVSPSLVNRTGGARHPHGLNAPSHSVPPGRAPPVRRPERPLSSDGQARFAPILLSNLRCSRAEFRICRSVPACLERIAPDWNREAIQGRVSPLEKTSWSVFSQGEHAPGSSPRPARLADHRNGRSCPPTAAAKGTIAPEQQHPCRHRPVGGRRQASA
jgi:hypothetical protein